MYFITTKRMLEVCFFQHTPTFIIEPEKGSRRGKGRLRTRRKGDENNEHGTTLQKCSGRRKPKASRRERQADGHCGTDERYTEPPGKSVYYRK